MEQLEGARQRLETHTGTHPVLVAWWTEYLARLEEMCMRACHQADEVVRDLHLVDDPATMGQLAAMHALTGRQ